MTTASLDRQRLHGYLLEDTLRRANALLREVVEQTVGPVFLRAAIAAMSRDPFEEPRRWDIFRVWSHPYEEQLVLTNGTRPLMLFEDANGKKYVYLKAELIEYTRSVVPDPFLPKRFHTFDRGPAEERFHVEERDFLIAIRDRENPQDYVDWIQRGGLKAKRKKLERRCAELNRLNFLGRV